MMGYFDDIQNFHEKFTGLGEHVPQGPEELDDDTAAFRIGFMIEELAEYCIASGYTNLARQLNEMHEHIKTRSHWLLKRNEGGRNMENQLDSMVDLVYVAIGTVSKQGMDFDEAWKRVHRANMAKELAQSADRSTRGFKFDVVKPRGWKPADLSDLVK